MWSFSPRRIPATYFFLVLIGAVYLGQLAAAGSLSNGAAYNVANTLPKIGYIFFNPWMHSDHVHIIENGIAFALLGWWTERRVGTRQFVIAVLVAGYLTNLAPPIFGFGGRGVGASGITNMLWAFFAAFQITMYAKRVGAEQPDYRQVLYHLAWFFVGLIFVAKSVAEYTGYLPAPGNTATGAHLTGSVLGTLWFTARRTGITFRNPLDTQHS